MQNELEKWIADNEIEYILRDRYGDSFDMVTVVPVGKLRALLAGKVLCNAEPVAERYGITYLDSSIQWDARLTEYGAELCEASSDDPFPKPLYAPAFPVRESDIGKEGGE